MSYRSCTPARRRRVHAERVDVDVRAGRIRQRDRAPDPDEPAHNRHGTRLTQARRSPILPVRFKSDWRAIQETLFLESIPGMRASIIKGLTTPVTQCAKDLTW
jgi:antitoxin YefM